MLISLPASDTSLSFPQLSSHLQSLSFRAVGGLATAVTAKMLTVLLYYRSQGVIAVDQHFFVNMDIPQSTNISVIHKISLNT